MIHFPCSTCGQPRAIQAMRAWIYDAPFCSDACVRDGQASGRFGTPPAAGGVLASASSTIATCTRLLEHVAGGARALDRAVGQAHDAAMVGVAVGVFAGGIAGVLAKNAMEAHVEHARSRHEDISWRMERETSKLVRELMALHALGYPIAAQMGPLVTIYATPPGTPAQMAAMRAYLAHLDRGIQVWIDELGRSG